MVLEGSFEKNIIFFSQEISFCGQIKYKPFFLWEEYIFKDLLRRVTATVVFIARNLILVTRSNIMY